MRTKNKKESKTLKFPALGKHARKKMDKEIDKYIKDGWVVKSVTGDGFVFGNFLFVYLEREQ